MGARSAEASKRGRVFHDVIKQLESCSLSPRGNCEVTSVRSTPAGHSFELPEHSESISSSKELRILGCHEHIERRALDQNRSTG
jgi:hypothetical protein